MSKLTVTAAGWGCSLGPVLSFALLLGYSAPRVFGIISLRGQNPLAGLWVLEKYGCKTYEVYSDGARHTGQTVAFTVLSSEACLHSQPQMGWKGPLAASLPHPPTHWGGELAAPLFCFFSLVFVFLSCHIGGGDGRLF